MTTYLNTLLTTARTATIVVVMLLSIFSFDHSTSSQTKTDQDGPVSVKYDDFFQPGELKIEPWDLKDLPPLPPGYAALNGTGYRITTTAIVAGNHTIRFVVPSVTDEGVFKKLRIFHAWPDEYDPDGIVWADVTLSRSSMESPSFSTKTIYGQSEGLGVYVIAKLVKEVPPNTSKADLVVTATDVSDTITAPTLATYTINVLNQGPDSATRIGVFVGHSGPAMLESAEASQGKCKPSGGHIACRVGSLKPGESLRIAVKLKPDEGRISFPKEGREIYQIASASAEERDPTSENNEATVKILALPDPNQMPSVTLTSPANQAIVIGPTDITLEATAEDPDGSISKVEFFDMGKSLGVGTSEDGKNFVFIARGLSYGRHIFGAVVTDNGGRTDWSTYREVFVNGLARLAVKSPKEGSLVAPGPDIKLTAVAKHPTGVIDKVEFYAYGKFLGEGTLVGRDTYSFNWKIPYSGTHSISVIAIDGSGISTRSASVTFKIGEK